MDNLEADYSYCHELGLAQVYWEADRELPFDLLVRLMELGYDVERLERRHRYFPN